MHNNGHSVQMSEQIDEQTGRHAHDTIDRGIYAKNTCADIAHT